MHVYEIIAGSVLMLACILLIIVVLLQDNKGNGLSGAIGGGESGGILQRGRGRMRDEKLAKITKILAIVLFAVVLVVDLLSLIKK